MRPFARSRDPIIPHSEARWVRGTEAMSADCKQADKSLLHLNYSQSTLWSCCAPRALFSDALLVCRRQSNTKWQWTQMWKLMWHKIQFPSHNSQWERQASSMWRHYWNCEGGSSLCCVRLTIANKSLLLLSPKRSAQQSCNKAAFLLRRCPEWDEIMEGRKDCSLEIKLERFDTSYTVRLMCSACNFTAHLYVVL